MEERKRKTRIERDQGTFTENLNSIMKERGLNQSSLAQKAGTCRRVVNEYCLGKKFPKEDYWADSLIVSIARALDVRIETLLGIPLSENQYEEWSFKETLKRKFEEEFKPFKCKDFSDKELNDLDDEIREFIRFKVSHYLAKKRNNSSK